MSLQNLVVTDKRIRSHEGESLNDRWEFGRELLGMRAGKQLPPGLLSELVGRTGTSRWELQTRVRFAERFSTREQVCDAITHFGSWYRIVHEALRASDVATEPKPIPDGQFSTIVADPPWRYGNTSTRGAAEDHYETMSIEELCELNIARERAADRAHLYLWTTAGHLPDAFKVMDAWGFTYKTYLVWAKPQMGMGNYFRVSTELVLFGIKGDMRTQHQGLMNWFQAKRGKHSAKPEHFYDELVLKASPGPYLEMFNRCYADEMLDGTCRCSGCRHGWSVWGDQS